MSVHDAYTLIKAAFEPPDLFIKLVKEHPALLEARAASCGIYNRKIASPI